MIRRILFLLATSGLLTACGTATSSDVAVAPDDRGVIVRTVDGVVNVETDSGTIRWARPGAAAAADGSRIYAVGASGRLDRLDPVSGAPVGSWQTPAGLTPVLVEPDGDRVVLSDRPLTTDSWTSTRVATRLGVLDVGTGNSRTLDVAADFEPEAFGTERSIVYGLDHRGDHYRVQWLDLTTGEHGDVIDRDKNPGGDMRGRPVHGVLSRDGRRLATLYVNADDADHPAFVHVLDLGGTTYCVELPADFAVGPLHSQSIERTGHDVLVVRAPAADRTARFDLTALDAPGDPPPPDITPGAGTPADAPYRRVPGFLGVLGPA